MVPRPCTGVAAWATGRCGNEQDIFIEDTEDKFGPIDLFHSNAGIAQYARLRRGMASHLGGQHHVPCLGRQTWCSHDQRGGGYLLNTASAAGLLSQIGSATYAVTKHAAVALAEYFHYLWRPGHQGFGAVSSSRSHRHDRQRPGVAGIDGMIELEDAVSAVVDAVRERFLVLPHPEVAEYMQRKTADYDRWLKGMRRLQGLYRKAK